MTDHDQRSPGADTAAGSVADNGRGPLIAAETEEGCRYIRGAGWRVPMGPWWLLLTTALLLPLLVFGGVMWLSGEAVRWRYLGTDYRPAGIRYFKLVGRWCFKIFWWPHLAYFRLAHPGTYRAWKATASTFGGAARKVVNVAGKVKDEVAGESASKDPPTK